MANWKADVKPLVDIALQGIGAMTSTLPSPYNLVAGLILTGLKYADDLIAQGVADPIEHIERIHAADPLLADTEGTWASAIKAKFRSE